MHVALTKNKKMQKYCTHIVLKKAMEVFSERFIRIKETTWIESCNIQ